MLAAPKRAAPSEEVSPGSDQPGPISTVGAGSSAPAPSTGNQWARMVVPSNDVTSRSLVDPATGAAATGASRVAGSQARRSATAGAPAVVVDVPSDPPAA